MFPENGQFPQSSLAARLRVTVSALPVPLPALWSCSAPDRTRPFVSRYLLAGRFRWWFREMALILVGLFPFIPLLATPNWSNCSEVLLVLL